MDENNGVEIIDTSIVEEENPEPTPEKPKRKRTKREIIALSVSSGILAILAAIVTTTLVIGFSTSTSTAAPSATWSTTSPGFYDANRQKVADIEVGLNNADGFYTVTSIKAEEKGQYLVLPSTYGNTRIIYTADCDSATNIFGNDGKDDNLQELYAQRLYYRIGSYSFAHLSSLKKVSLASAAEGTQAISSYAFYDCPALTTVELSRNVTSIGANAFASSPITSLIYPGTKANWQSTVNIGENAFASGTVVTCSDGTITL